MEGVTVLALCILNLGTRWRRSGQHHAQASLPGPGTLQVRGWVGIINDSRLWGRKNACPSENLTLISQCPAQISQYINFTQST
jgi:hypothetical protein